MKHQRVGRWRRVAGYRAVRENTERRLKFVLTAGKFKKGTSTPGQHIDCQERKKSGPIFYWL